MNFEMDSYVFEPVDIDDEIFLSEIPLSILESSLKEQFNDPLEYRKKDYIQSFITKYEYSVANMMEEDLTFVEIKHDDFMIFVKNLFYDRLRIGFVDLGDKDSDEQHELIHLVYRFFIKNIKKNFVNVIHNWIIENKKDILDKYEKKKDVTSNTFKGELSDEYDVLVLSNLGDLVDDVLEDVRAEGDVEKFLELCNGKGTCLELEYIKHAYKEATVTGNFISEYIDMIDDTFKIEVESKIRSRILKKYPVRVRKNIEMEEQEENESIEDGGKEVPVETEPSESTPDSNEE